MGAHLDALVGTSQLTVTAGTATIAGRANVWVQCWPPVVRVLREELVIGDEDVNLLGLADTPEEAVALVRRGLREGWQVGQGPRG